MKTKIFVYYLALISSLFFNSCIPEETIVTKVAPSQAPIIVLPPKSPVIGTAGDCPSPEGYYNVQPSAVPSSQDSEGYPKVSIEPGSLKFPDDNTLEFQVLIDSPRIYAGFVIEPYIDVTYLFKKMDFKVAPNDGFKTIKIKLGAITLSELDGATRRTITLKLDDASGYYNKYPDLRFFMKGSSYYRISRIDLRVSPPVCDGGLPYQAIIGLHTKDYSFRRVRRSLLGISGTNKRVSVISANYKFMTGDFRLNYIFSEVFSYSFRPEFTLEAYYADEIIAPRNYFTKVMKIQGTSYAVYVPKTGKGVATINLNLLNEFPRKLKHPYSGKETSLLGIVVRPNLSLNYKIDPDPDYVVMEF
ncbi:MAG: hypothetical protein ACEQSF_03450 [Solirubrobacteraceae bacterium]